MIDVEHDISGTLGAVRRQGKRPTCLAFTASDLNAAANRQSHLSVEYLCHHAAQSMEQWTAASGFTMASVLQAARQPGQPLEHDYLYRPDDPEAPHSAPDADLSPLYMAPSQRRGLTLDEVESEVATGRAAGVVIAATQSLFKPLGGVIDFDPMAIAHQYHAMVAVAVGTHATSGERHLLLRNSWGPGWGRNGHAWAPRTHLKLHWLEGMVF